MELRSPPRGYGGDMARYRASYDLLMSGDG
jgi:hypothetical protein